MEENKENFEINTFEEANNPFWETSRPSISALVFADEGQLDCTEEMENTENFLLAETNIVPRTDLQRESIQSYSSESGMELTSSSIEKYTISLDEFLSLCKIQFRIFNQVPQKFSIDFDVNRRNSASLGYFLSETETLEKYFEKEFFLKQNIMFSKFQTNANQPCFMRYYFKFEVEVFGFRNNDK